MCGINLIVALKSDLDLKLKISEMNELIIHRGPDSQGSLVYRNVGMGHRRLSIIDLSSQGTQPITWGEDYVITYNGEIYNYLELKEELKLLGYTFQTNTDTEVILVAYKQWGQECTKRFNGMWAFVILDKRLGKLFCSRDHFGIKPFYYIVNEKGIFISSEIKPLLQFLPEVRAHKKAVLNYLVLDICDEGEFTFFEGVKRLLPATNLWVDIETCNLEFQEFYKLGELNTSYRSYNGQEQLKLVNEIFESSVKLRLRSDVKVGTCLSGGLDSSLIAAKASNEHKKNSAVPFLAYTSKSTDSSNDESGYAKKVVEMFGLDWVVSEPNKVDFLGSLDELIKIQEEPFRSPSIFMQYEIMKESKKSGCTVLLDGQGGDEVFLGYERYYIPYLRSLNAFHRFSEFWKVVNHSKLNPVKLIALYFYMSSNWFRKRVLRSRVDFIKKEYMLEVSWGYLKELASANITQLQILEISKFNLPALLRYEDKNSMHFSLETRLPFLDYRLVECSLAMRNNYKINKGWTKVSIRKIADGLLPDSITWRKNKFGFESPMRDWLSNKQLFIDEINNSLILKELLNTKYTSFNDLNLLWRMYNLAKWESIFGVLMFK
jgi:asparagine synthase (glutamine-hydrolysing)